MKEKKPIDHIYEKAFSDYLDSEEYDRAEEILFSVIRQAFFAGWTASEQNKIRILQMDKEK